MNFCYSAGLAGGWCFGTVSWELLNPRVSREKGRLRITKSFWLEDTCKIIESNHQPCLGGLVLSSFRRKQMISAHNVPKPRRVARGVSLCSAFFLKCGRALRAGSCPTMLQHPPASVPWKRLKIPVMLQGDRFGVTGLGALQTHPRRDLFS